MPMRGASKLGFVGCWYYWLGIGFGFDRGALPLGLNMVQVMRRVSTCCGCNLKVVCSSQRVLGQLQIATTCPHRRYTALQCEPRKSGGGALLIRFGVDGRRVASVGSSDLDVYFGPRRSCLLVSFRFIDEGHGTRSTVSWPSLVGR